MIGIDEACKVLRRGESTIYALTQVYIISFYRSGKMLLFKCLELMAWMEETRQVLSIETKEHIKINVKVSVRSSIKAIIK